MLIKKNFRLYGNSPYHTILIHGGPGAAGSLAPLAKKIALNFGVIEALQTEDSLQGQIKELKNIIDTQATSPIILIGHSWGAMLGYLFCAYHPTYASKLIMISSGSFEAKYARNIESTILSRLTPEQKLDVNQLSLELKNNDRNNENAFQELGRIFEIADTFDPTHFDTLENFPGQYEIYQKVWPEVAKLRETSELLSLGKNITCPVTAIHGDYDSHPYQGVKEPLSPILQNLSFHLLEKCGHQPWIERHTQEAFFQLINKEIYQALTPEIKLQR